MTSRSLSPLFDRIVAAAMPLVVTASSGTTVGCCPPYEVTEVRVTRGLPEGWTWGPGGAYLQSEDDIYAASPGSPELSGDECAALCGEEVVGCELVSPCTPLTTVRIEGDRPIVEAEGGAGGQGGQGGSGSTGTSAPPDPCASPNPPAGYLLVSCQVTYGATCGRRPYGMRTPRRSGRATLGSFLRDCHRLEAASVVAFEVLGRELAHHGAPRELSLAAADAMHEERRHASAMAGLSRKYGATPSAAPPRRERRPRSLVKLAIENVREGCVRETYGALLAHWQGKQAAQTDIRAAFAALAGDETRHAELSHAVHAWAMGRLSAAERARVESARRRAIARLARDLETPPPVALARPAGLPPPAIARFLLAELTAALG